MSFMESKPVQTNTTGTSSLPAWLTDLAKSTALKSQDIAGKGYQAWGGPNPYGGQSEDTRSGFQGLRDWITGGNGGTSKAIEGVMTADAQKVATEGTFDGEGIDKYINKYTESALNPALRKITESADAARNRLKAGATSAGSFGDARHGVVESGIDKNQGIAIGDTAGQFMNQAFNQAVGARQNDLGRKLQADTTTASFAEQGLGRQMAGAQARDNQQMTWLRQLLGAGEYQDSRDTAAKQFDLGQFTEGRDWDKNQMTWLMQMLNGTPSDKTTTQTSSQTGGTSPWAALLGGLLQGVGGKI